MQKKIIALAIASALTAPALAFAEATVYGQINMSIASKNDGGSPSSTNTAMDNGGSRLGFTGSEDLGGGLAVVWTLEGDVQADTGVAGGATNSTPITGDNSLFDRASNIGLKGDWGTVAVGVQDSPYKASTRGLDLFGDSEGDNRALMGIGHDTGSTNAISYSSPNMNGFSVVAATVFGAENAISTDTKGTAFSLAGMYGQGPIYATLAYDTATFGDAGSGILGGVANDKSSDFKVGGSYSVEQGAVNAVIERRSDTIAALGGGVSGTNVYIAGKFNVSGTDAVKAAYAKKGATTAGGVGQSDSATQVSVGYDHSLSKATSVGVLYTKITDNATGAPDPSALAVGIKHSF